MKIHLIRQKLFIPIIALLFLSGCSAHTNLSSIFKSTPQPEDIDTIDVVENDKDLEEVEPLLCLDEELNQLNQTGGWNEPTSLVTENISKEPLFDFPVVLNKQVNMYLDLFQNKQRKQFGRWLAKSGKYKAMMEDTLTEAGLPKDLIYLSMIESGYSPLAYSRSKAVGLWQFMKRTGQQYNLSVNKYVDERRDASKATVAAANYLSDLYKEFGDWHLAVAAYNGGPGKVRSGLRRHKVDNFWDLASKRHLRLETKRYVPKLIAAIIIAKEPGKYGFTGIQYAEPLLYESLTVGPGMSLDAIALISNSSRKEIKNLNLELRKGKTPSNLTRYQVNIPLGTAALAQANISRLHSIVSTGYKTHKIRKGDNLTKICKRYGINKTTLLKVNNLRSNTLVSGTNLRIPYSTISYRLLPEGSSKASSVYRDSLVLHRIKKGDTISRIAWQYRVPQDMIVAWNGLKSVHSIREGQQLALYIDRGTTKAKPLHIAKKKKFSSQQRLVLKQTKQKQHHKISDTDFHYYSVKNGDSLWTISRKFRATTTDIKKWNNLKSNLIHPGSKLKLKKG
jgi:membrane-bound lytic murein transglycosylase D